MNVFDRFSIVSGLKLNMSICEIVGIGDLQKANVALCSMQCINLKKESLKILEINFSYNKKLEQENNFKFHIVKIENDLKL